MLNVALIGYGKMGKMLHSLALAHNINISAIINSVSEFETTDWKTIDVAIDFSIPDAAIDNIHFCFKQQVPIVVGTTGWYKAFDKVSSMCTTLNGTLFYATNFSLGVNLFWKIAAYSAKLFEQFPEYQFSISETHHTQKLDAPSGTAITLAENIIANNTNYTGWALSETAPSTLPIEAIRANNINGIHTLLLQSSIDEITITHNAYSREGFAIGALKAAHFIKDKKGIYSMNDLLAL